MTRLTAWTRPVLRLAPTYQVGTLLVVAALAWVTADAFLVRPQAVRTRALQDRVWAVEREVGLLRAQTEPSAPISVEERTLFTAIDARIAERFPPEAELPRALDAVARLVRQSGIELTMIRLETRHGAGAAPPPGGVPAPSAPPLPVDRPLHPHGVVIRVQLHHDYGRLAELLDGLGTLPVLLHVDSLEMTPADGRVASELVLVGFRIES